MSDTGTELSKGEAVLLARLDERTKYLVDGLPQMKTDLTNSINEVKTSLDNTKIDFSKALENVKKDNITREEFNPIRNIVYGFVGMILVAVVSAMIYLVVKHDFNNQNQQNQNQSNQNQYQSSQNNSLQTK